MVIYQSPCSRHNTLIRATENVFFSVSVKYRSRPGFCTLLLRCSGNKDFCAKSYGRYQFCHSPEETLQVRVLPGHVLSVSMKNGLGDKKIVQTTTPFVMDRVLDHPLDEQFNISVANETLSTRPTRSVSSRQGQDDFFFSWEVQTDTDSSFSMADGLLQVQQWRHPSQIDESDLFDVLVGYDDECKACNNLALLKRGETDVVGCLPFSFQSPEESQRTGTAADASNLSTINSGES